MPFQVRPFSPELNASASLASPAPLAPAAAAAEQPVAQPLTDEHELEVLAFLAERPLHTAVMASFIRDNGLESPFNRGSFYGHRDAAGQLDGVALIGHGMFLEARSDAALRAFALRAQTACDRAHMLMGEQEQIARFWSYYANGGQAPRLFCRESLFELRWPVPALPPVAELRPATLDDLGPVMLVHAALAYEESGVDPLQTDPQGFRLRCARRIEQGRVWVWIENERLIFKADIVAETPEVVYLEGVYVEPRERRQGLGLRCLSQLNRHLLGRAAAVTTLVNEQNRAGQAFFRRAGFKLRATYDTIFLAPKND